MSYSFKKGLVKGVYGALGAAIFVVSFTHFADVSIWALLEIYLKPLLGSMTIAGLLVLGKNFIKFHYGVYLAGKR